MCFFGAFIGKWLPLFQSRRELALLISGEPGLEVGGKANQAGKNKERNQMQKKLHKNTTKQFRNQRWLVLQRVGDQKAARCTGASREKERNQDREK
ncbi:MAG: hypothetical protein M3Z23_06725 [Acidobacteriota bacterium]|nr:hypothetical protein [Acidobacteriota bacterium]